MLLRHRVRCAFVFGALAIGIISVLCSPITTGDSGLIATPPAAATNPPYGSIQLSSDRVYRGQTLEYNVTVGAENWPLEYLNWSFAIQNNTGTPASPVWTNITSPTTTEVLCPHLNGTWVVPLYQPAGTHRVILGVRNDTDFAWVYKYFEVLNNLPSIKVVTIDKSSVKRGETVNVTIEASDVEVSDLAPDSGTNPSIYVRLYLRDTLGKTTTVNAIRMPNGNYSGLLTIASTSPTGNYTMWVGVQDYRAGVEPQQEVTSNLYFIFVTNNNPTFTIDTDLLINNQKPSSSVSIRSGDPLNITISASDTDGGIRVVHINLRHLDSDMKKNYTLNWANLPHSLIINTGDLAVGTWAVYITIVDVDGGIYEPAEHPLFEVTADTWTVAAPIVAFIIGIPVGLALGIGLTIWRMGRKRVTEDVEETEEVSARAEKPEKQGKADKGKKAPPSLEKPSSSPKDENSEESREAEGGDQSQLKRKIRRRIE